MYAKQDTNNRLVFNDFTKLAIGKWNLFVDIENKSYPLDIKENIFKAFSTSTHNIEILTGENDNVLFNVKPHVFNIDDISFSKNKESLKILISSNNFDPGYQYKLVVDDVKADKAHSYSLNLYNNGYQAQCVLTGIFYNLSKKRFFIYRNGTQPIRFQLGLKGEPGSIYTSFRELVNSQLVTFSFYRRKDHSLGLKHESPTIEKYVTKIKGSKISGYINNVDNNFVDCKKYLYVEERNTKEFIRIPVGDRFDVDLSNYNLIDLKSKEKTLFDFFLVLFSNEGELIRKEKIRFKYADYKKDNYYDHVSVEDHLLNTHHFLYTTTPFDNLKLETFMVPFFINIPDDTSNKDENVWLIGERSNTAQDNGIALFNWLQQNTNVDAYYVIEADSEDYDKIKGRPNVLEFGSLEHYNIAFKAKVLLCTHDLENILPYKPAKDFFHYENTYRIFLQHGVLGRKNVEYHKKYYDLPLNYSCI